MSDKLMDEKTVNEIGKLAAKLAISDCKIKKFANAINSNLECAEELYDELTNDEKILKELNVVSSARAELLSFVLLLKKEATELFEKRDVEFKNRDQIKEQLRVLMDGLKEDEDEDEDE